jgi:hypothetical protein
MRREKKRKGEKGREEKTRKKWRLPNNNRSE